VRFQTELVLNSSKDQLLKGRGQLKKLWFEVSLKSFIKFFLVRAPLFLLIIIHTSSIVLVL
jgi:hypothetical protein